MFIQTGKVSLFYGITLKVGVSSHEKWGGGAIAPPDPPGATPMQLVTDILILQCTVVPIIYAWLYTV